MLAEMGVESFQDLLRGIPLQLQNPKIDLPPAASEFQIMREVFSRLGGSQDPSHALSFLGGGSYEHFVPAAVSQIVMRNEFYTAYTPYQAEASQGTLQAIFEYQSLLAELTGLDVSNASHYDGATALSEAALMVLRHTERNTILVSSTLHPHYRETLQTYFKGTSFVIEEFSADAQGRFSSESFKSHLNERIAGAIFQTPNFLGVVEDLAGIADALHEVGAQLILVSNPLSLGIYRSPAEWGADLAVGEGQPLGIRRQFGGPYLGYMVASRALMRKLPGRLVGVTQDSEGKRAYVLTLTAREQHIRREKASSNICTNQGLCALIACVYMTLLGRQGIRKVAELNIDRASYLRDQISKLKDYSVDLETPIFNEFVVRSKKPFADIEKAMMARNIFPGLDLEKYYPRCKQEFLVCATETKSREDLDRYVEALKAC